MFDEKSSALTVNPFAGYPIQFDRLMRNSHMITAAGVNVRICAIDDLIDMKSGTGRRVDELDIENLKAIQSQQNRGDKS